LKKREADFENTLDVRAEINALDIVDRNAVLPDGLRHRALTSSPSRTIMMQSAQNGICMSAFGLSLFVAMGVAMVAMVVVVSTCLLRPSGKGY